MTFEKGEVDIMETQAWHATLRGLRYIFLVDHDLREKLL